MVDVSYRSSEEVRELMKLIKPAPNQVIRLGGAGGVGASVATINNAMVTFTTSSTAAVELKPFQNWLANLQAIEDPTPEELDEVRRSIEETIRRRANG